MTRRSFPLLLLAVLTVSLSAGPVAAAETVSSSTPLLAGYWQGFIEHWTGVFQKQNGIVMLTVVVGALCLFIITRGKWRK